MNYFYTVLYAESVIETIEFYEKVFGFSRKFISPANNYAELNSGETTISFASFSLGDANFKKGFEKISNTRKPMGVEWAFTAKNIEWEF